MSEWIRMKLSECCSSIADGDHQPPPKAKTGIPFVTISNMTSTNQFDFSDTLFVPQEYYDKLDEKRKARKDDILYSVVGSFGIPVFMKEDKAFVFQRHIAILRPDNEKIVPRFLFYTMLTKDFYAKADAVAIGAAQRTVSLTALRNMEIDIPDRIQQSKIVDTLAAYDDLIENNQKQIKLLEEVAYRLYKEWFVDLRFPGHDNADIVDGMPKGWSLRPVSSFGEVVTGKTPSTSKSEYYGGDIPFVKIPDMHGVVFPIETETTLSDQGAKSQKNKFIPKNSIMVSCIATVGLVNISVTNCQTNQQINSLVLKNMKDLYYVYASLKRIKELLDGVGSNGATMTNVNKNKFERIEILYPNRDLVEKYQSFCAPIYDEILTLSLEMLRLQEKRNRLLPKLVSGEIEV